MVTRNESSNQSRNRILASLPQKEYERLLPKMEEVYIEQGRCLIAPQESIREVYFPLNSMISLISLTREGLSVETGIVGSEGMLGVPVLFDTTSTPMQSIVQLSGMAMRMQAQTFKTEFDRGGQLYRVLLRYLHVLVIEISQTAACNKLHTIKGRLGRWLLMSSDSIHSEELPLTHEFLATMLGVRRAGVSEAAGQLKKRGLIDYHHGSVTILDRRGLQEVACECYDIVSREYSRLFPQQ
jgi:CRP-like cAMP-binding protein